MPISGTLLAFIIVILLVFSFVFYPRVESFFIYYPEASFETLPSDWQLTYEDVYFDTEDHTRLHGWFFPLKGNAPVILFCHGNAGNISHRLENIVLLLRQNLQVLIFDYRGYGKSGGRPSEKGLYLDGLAAYDFLVKNKHIPRESIVPFGRSLGAAVAIEIALRRDVRSLIIESAFTSTKEMAKTLFLFKIFSYFLPPHYHNRERLGRVIVPKLIIHGRDDEIVPFSMGEELYDIASEPKYFFPIARAHHNDTYLVGGKTYFEKLSAFVRDSRI
ncbi:MAG TPA: alpha/beta hydrolase [Acidobacteriota bacterium]|nr:alpha/beta hydrolase [Acidobacteriota bacterium]